MEERKTIKISLSSFFLTLAIIVIIVMAYFINKMYNEKLAEIEKISNLNNQINKSENFINDLQEKNESLLETLNTNNQTSKKNEKNNNNSRISFTEIMDMMYIEDGIKINGNKYEKYPHDSAQMLIENSAGEVINVEETDVRYYGGEINLNIRKTELNLEISTNIKGISEEVVTIKLIQVEGGATPSYIYFLTRNGNVYYINEEMISQKNFVAKKVDNLKEVVAIETMGVLYSGAMEGSTTLVATTYYGEKIDI